MDTEVKDKLGTPLEVDDLVAYAGVSRWVQPALVGRIRSLEGGELRIMPLGSKGRDIFRSPDQVVKVFLPDHKGAF